VPGRLDRVQVQFASRDEPLNLPWDSRNKLLAEIRDRQSVQTIVAEFENAGASRPVKFSRAQAADLVEAVDEWARRVGSISELRGVVWDLRCARADELHEAERD
jgi:hypothetical protein